MSENATKPVKSNITFADVLDAGRCATRAAPFESLAWITRTLSSPRISSASATVFFKPVRGRDVVARRQQVAGVETKADRQIRHLRRVFANHVQFFEAAADLRARADRALDQQHQLAELQPLRPLRRRLRGNEECPARWSVLCNSPDAPPDTPRRSRWRVPARRETPRPTTVRTSFMRRRQVDQVIVVNHQRRQVVAYRGRDSTARSPAALGTDAFHWRGLEEKI